MSADIQTALPTPSPYSPLTLKSSPVCPSQGNGLEENPVAENKQKKLPALFRDFKHYLTFWKWNVGKVSVSSSCIDFTSQNALQIALNFIPFLYLLECFWTLIMIPILFTMQVCSHRLQNLVWLLHAAQWQDHITILNTLDVVMSIKDVSLFITTHDQVTPFLQVPACELSHCSHPMHNLSLWQTQDNMSYLMLFHDGQGYCKYLLLMGSSGRFLDKSSTYVFSSKPHCFFNQAPLWLL